MSRIRSSGQARLAPVISTLLQFTSHDLKEIKKASRRSSWGVNWGDKKDYKPIMARPASAHSMAAAMRAGASSTAADPAASATDSHSSHSNSSSIARPPRDRHQPTGPAAAAAGVPDALTIDHHQNEAALPVAPASTASSRSSSFSELDRTHSDYCAEVHHEEKSADL